MSGRRVLSALKNRKAVVKPQPSAAPPPPPAAAEEGTPRSWGRRIVSGALLCLTGGVALSAVNDLLIYHGCSSKAMEKASKNKRIIDAIGEPIVRGPWNNASLAVAHNRQGTGIFQLKAVRNGEDSWLSILGPQDWEILIMEALLHIPNKDEKERTFRISVSDEPSLQCKPCVAPQPSGIAHQNINPNKASS